MSGWRGIAFALALLACARAGAEVHDAGDLVVHYTALGTMELAPQVAQAYGIARSPNRGLLNVAVLARAADGTESPVPAQVRVTAIDPLGRVKPVSMRRIDEPPAVYSIGELSVADAEVVRFEILVLVEGRQAPITLRLQHQFFTR